MVHNEFKPARGSRLDLSKAYYHRIYTSYVFVPQNASCGTPKDVDPMLAPVAHHEFKVAISVLWRNQIKMKQITDF